MQIMKMKQVFEHKTENLNENDVQLRNGCKILIATIKSWKTFFIAVRSLAYPSSVTRFGKNSPLWNFLSVFGHFQGLNSI